RPKCRGSGLPTLLPAYVGSATEIGRAEIPLRKKFPDERLATGNTATSHSLIICAPSHYCFDSCPTSTPSVRRWAPGAGRPRAGPRLSVKVHLTTRRVGVRLRQPWRAALQPLPKLSTAPGICRDRKARQRSSFRIAAEVHRRMNGPVQQRRY